MMKVVVAEDIFILSRQVNTGITFMVGYVPDAYILKM
jgi:hypothetical protein